MGGMLEVEAQLSGNPHHVDGWVAVLAEFRLAYWPVHVEYHDAGERTGDYAYALDRKPRPSKTLRLRRLVSDREGPRLLL
jgi:hypothetical protein